MPELPEVETVVRSLAPHATGRLIIRAAFGKSPVVRQDAGVLASHLEGRRIERLERRGKFILFHLDRGVLSVHLGMTGRLLANAEPGPYTRASLTLDAGSLLYDDIRQFGRIEWSAEAPAGLARLGPDPLTVTAATFHSILRGRRGRIKSLLLNQRLLAGIGNIYADEILFRARIHPLAAAGRLGPARLERLLMAARQVLEQAISRGGSSISDYVDSEGRSGSFQLLHQVYGKQGSPCPRCGAAIRKIVVAQRGTHYCPHCQRP